MNGAPKKWHECLRILQEEAMNAVDATATVAPVSSIASFPLLPKQIDNELIDFP